LEERKISPNELDDINPADIYSIEVLTSISHLSIYGSNAPNGALIITLKSGAGNVNLANISVDGLITYKLTVIIRRANFTRQNMITKALLQYLMTVKQFTGTQTSLLILMVNRHLSFSMPIARARTGL